MVNKEDMYKIGLSEQHTRHCRAQVQAGYYTGTTDGDVNCPNCGMKEKVEHLCVFPDEDKTQLLREMTDKFLKNG